MIFKQIRGDSTHSLHNPSERVMQQARTHTVVDEVELVYEIWQGHLTVPLRVLFSKSGILVTDGPSHDRHEIDVSWEHIDSIKRELGL